MLSSLFMKKNLNNFYIISREENYQISSGSISFLPLVCFTAIRKIVLLLASCRMCYPKEKEFMLFKFQFCYETLCI